MTSENDFLSDFEVKEKCLLLLNGEISFSLSEDAFDFNQVKWFNEIPVLFPIRSNHDLYSLKDGKLIFHHDIIKSIFYLLSGYQEYLCDVKDQYCRFPFEESLQYKLEIIHRPIVNYYFDIILSAFELFNQQLLVRKRVFQNFGFVLSHDVDRVAYYHIRETLFKVKQFLGISPSSMPKIKILFLFFKGMFKFLRMTSLKDPWWNFDEMVQLEKDLRIRSSFYFLENQNPKKDSYYSFNNKKIQKLVKSLAEQKFEIGIHGSFASAYDQNAMISSVKHFEKSFGFAPQGARQHFLRFNHPNTFTYQQKAGLKYDTSLSFAEHEGFRNSYCHPFFPYDFANDCMLNIVEIPLVVMEVTWLQYRELSKDKIIESLHALIAETVKFGGLFTLLWHNCRLEEMEQPGINQLYSDILVEILKQQPECLIGEQVYKRFTSL